MWLGTLRLGNISCQTSAKPAAARLRVALQRRWLSMQHDVNLLPVGFVQQGNVADVSCFNSAWDVLKVSGACWGWERGVLHGGVIISAFQQLDYQACKGCAYICWDLAAHG